MDPDFWRVRVRASQGTKQHGYGCLQKNEWEKEWRGKWRIKEMKEEWG